VTKEVGAFLALLRKKLKGDLPEKQIPGIRAICRALVTGTLPAKCPSLETLSYDHPLRFAKEDTFLRVTFHLKMTQNKIIYLEFDTNSKCVNSRGQIVNPTKDKPPITAGKLRKFINDGSFKQVRHGWRLNGQTGEITRIAISVSSNIRGNDDSLKLMQREARFAELTYKNPFFIQLLPSQEYEKKMDEKTVKKMSLSSPFMDGGELLDFLKGMKENFNPDLGDIVWISYSLAKGLLLLHQAGIIYRDLRPENVLFAHNGVGYYIKMTDLGLAMTNQEAKGSRGDGLGSEFWSAFDSPLFAKVCAKYIAAHNIIIDESRDQTTTPINLYVQQKMAPYIQEATRHQFFFQVYCLAQTTQKIEQQPTVHPKDDVWALCLIFYYLGFYSSSSLKKTGFIKQLDQFSRRNIYALRKDRVTSEELFVKITKLMEKAKAKSKKVRKKINDQLKLLNGSDPSVRDKKNVRDEKSIGAVEGSDVFSDTTSSSLTSVSQSSKNNSQAIDPVAVKICVSSQSIFATSTKNIVKKADLGRKNQKRNVKNNGLEEVPVRRKDRCCVIL